ncbi:MAG TPA: GNAT family N-acetyltransferase [Euzebya sp.]|nr:GNAT family N-acetyltransferase [Euzebya sp.]
MTTEDLQIRPYQPADDAPQVMQLMASSLGWTDDPFFEAFFRWKHQDGPWGPSPSWVSVTADGRIVGFRAMMRWQFTRGGTPVTAVRAVDTATDPSFRGRGIFRTLTLHAVEQLAAQGVDMVFNTPNEQSRPGYLKMGWHEVGQLPVRMVPTTPGKLMNLRGARTGADLRSIPTEVGVAAVDVIDRAVPVATAGRLHTQRSPEYLRWRYGLADLHYRAIAGPRGVVIFRLRRRGTAVECVVADLLVRDAQVARSAVRWLRHNSGADYLIGLASDPRPIGGIPIPGQGPMLTWRPLASSWRPELGDFAVSMGDIELF